MDYRSIEERFKWVPYDGQVDSNVTYLFVANRAISRLLGESNILYVGKTAQAIAVRYAQETKARNSPRNTQQTNIRMTHIFGEIGLENCQCIYVKGLSVWLSGNDRATFIDNLMTWDKQFFLGMSEHQNEQEIEVPLEKYLLVGYAADHLELPPMNNRF